MNHRAVVELPEELCKKIESCGLSVSDEIEDAIQRLLKPKPEAGVAVEIIRSKVN
jgi:hypothetical protein